MADEVRDAAALEAVELLAREVADAGRQMRLPFIAVSADISSPDPMLGRDGRPLAETVFRWLDPAFRYWEDRSFALRSAFVHAARTCAEPFYFREGRFGGWRTSRVLDALNETDVESFGVGAAIVAPTYLPAGMIGAVVWASPDAEVAVEAMYARRVNDLHALALRFIATYHEAWHPVSVQPAARLTRREIQCLKWAAAGKTDADIALIVRISVPTVRFHMTNAWRKLEVAGRAAAIHRAAALGYIAVRH